MIGVVLIFKLNQNSHSSLLNINEQTPLHVLFKLKFNVTSIGINFYKVDIFAKLYRLNTDHQHGTMDELLSPP